MGRKRAYQDIPPENILPFLGQVHCHVRHFPSEITADDRDIQCSPYDLMAEADTDDSNGVRPRLECVIDVTLDSISGLRLSSQDGGHEVYELDDPWINAKRRVTYSRCILASRPVKTIY